MNRRQIGDALDHLSQDVRRLVLSLISQYRRFGLSECVRQAVDTPTRTRAQIAAWMADYDARNGAGAAQTFLGQCLFESGSSRVLSDINDELAALEAQAMVMVDNVENQGWTLDDVAAAIEEQVQMEAEEQFVFSKLPIPDGYVTVWGDPY